jgi:hypothetical protein
MVDGSLGMATRVTNGGYYRKVKQVATVVADQDVVIKAGPSARSTAASRISAP